MIYVDVFIFEDTSLGKLLEGEALSLLFLLVIALALLGLVWLGLRLQTVWKHAPEFFALSIIPAMIVSFVAVDKYMRSADLNFSGSFLIILAAALAVLAWAIVGILSKR